ncbi:MAG: DUF6655 family protein [Planctomycetaceae bacterium]
MPGLLLLATGCTNMSTSNTARTSMEQLLISNAIDSSLDKINFTPFAGSNVYLDEKYVESVDSKYLVASVRHRLWHSGARLVDSPDNADVVVEMRSGGVGTSNSEAYIGTPEIGVPGMVSIPEVKLIERNRQSGTAKIGLVAYDPKSREILGDGGIALSESNDSNWFVVGVGPWQTGTVREEVSTRTSVQPTHQPQKLPLQVAFRGANRAPPDAPPATTPGEGQVQYAGWPEAEAGGAVSNPQ